MPLGATRAWRLTNVSSVTHYIHLHEEQWHTISRDGKPPPKWERGLEDTWRLDPGESVVVAAKFTDHTGVFMIHCHMLDHEDDGMMTTLYVNQGTTGPRVGDNLARLPVEASPELARWAAQLASGKVPTIGEACGENVDGTRFVGPFGMNAEAVDHPLRWWAGGQVADVQLAER